MSKEFKTGLIALVIIIGFIWGYNFLKGQNLFDTGTRIFKVEYGKIGGLTRSSAVTINGLKVGKVDKIEFNTTKEKRGHLIVTFIVENEFQFSKKSIVKIYSPNPLSGSNLAIVPNYEGEMAVSGDVLQGEMEESLFTSIGERLNPLQQKIEKVIVRADTLFSGINKILNDETVDGINNSVSNLAATIADIRSTIQHVNSLVVDNQENLKVTFENTRNITENFSKLSDSLTTVNINQIVQKAENAVDNFNELSKKINSGDGSIAKLINDKKMYNNLEAATKELEELLRDIKLNPKRYVHFSIFGKNPGPYEELEKVKE
ncbi:MCE family protein [Polaribacter aestuariivivens]|uniref:MCE family protein n=1 Tax=Polaribacter aestuariivivens TaxID=2304626 RepID=A0A5S3N9X3_9FLAO|nr:MlaD family protein [Polaribacter aestuariivivens]TMM31907.1 MCE family protein [Polaribacter aestuariivivens]